MSLRGPWGGAEPGPDARAGRPSAAQEEQRRSRAARLATGTLACPRCDAPVILPVGTASPSQPLACPYCRHAGAVRDFLSLAAPTRPARVTVRVVHPRRPAPR